MTREAPAHGAAQILTDEQKPLLLPLDEQERPEGHNDR